MFHFNASWSGLENRFEKFRKNIYQFLVKLKTYSLRHVYIPATYHIFRTAIYQDGFSFSSSEMKRANKAPLN